MTTTVITSERVEVLVGRSRPTDPTATASPPGGPSDGHTPGGGAPPSSPADVTKPAPQTATSKQTWMTSLVAAIVGIAAVMTAWALAVNLIADTTFSGSVSAPTPVEGLTIFAVFFVTAAGIERFLEPIASVVSAKSTKPEASAAAIKAWSAWEEASKKATGAQATDADKTAEQDAREVTERAMKVLADATASSDAASQWMKVLFWAFATATGIVASAALKLYLLRQVGIADAPRSLEILATGLIIGAGTKPLHDLVTMLEAKKDSAESTASAKSASA